MTTASVTDARSNFNDQIAHAVNVLKRSEKMRSLFDAICKGGAKPKTVKQLMGATGFTQVNTLQLGGKLADQQLVHKMRVRGETAYAKDRFYATNRSKITRLISNPDKFKELETKVRPKGSSRSALFPLRLKGCEFRFPRSRAMISINCERLGR